MPSETSETMKLSGPMRHFLDLALEGKRPGCSSGERAARELAICALEFVPRLDGQAMAGFAQFAELCESKPCTARDLADAW